MPIILGQRSLIQNVVPTGIDATYLYRFAMQQEMNPMEVMQMAAIVIGDANEYAAAIYGGLFSLTERLYAVYRQGNGVRQMTPKASEYAEEDGATTERIGHMLFIEQYKDATPWSRDYLEAADPEGLRDDVLMKKEDWINRVDYEMIRAMLRKSEIAVGSVGKAVSWVDQSGSIDYVPPQWMNVVHDDTHTHFLRTNAALSAANALSMIDSLAAHLTHHGHTGMKAAFVGDNVADALTSSNDKRIATYIPAEFRLLSGNTNAPISTVAGQIEGIPGEIVCYVTTKNGLVEVRRHPRIPQVLPDGNTAAGHIWMGKSYGVQDARNPLAIRLKPGKGFGLRMDPQVDRSINPSLEKLLFRTEFGVNVNDRTAGVAGQIASGGTSYEEPTAVNLA